MPVLSAWKTLRDRCVADCLRIVARGRAFGVRDPAVEKVAVAASRMASTVLGRTADHDGGGVGAGRRCRAAPCGGPAYLARIDIEDAMSSLSHGGPTADRRRDRGQGQVGVCRHACRVAAESRWGCQPTNASPLGLQQASGNPRRRTAVSGRLNRVLDPATLVQPSATASSTLASQRPPGDRRRSPYDWVLVLCRDADPAATLDITLLERVDHGECASGMGEHSPPLGFVIGTPVFIVGGRYDGVHGDVVDRAPDLRPGSVWVDLRWLGTHLVPTCRLTHCDDEPRCTHRG